jgi:cytochrome c biogenesis protein CcdA
VWAAIATTASVIWWAFVYSGIEENPLYGLAYPLGAALMLYIFATAIMRGRKVTWKGRSYVAK